jgi:predicted amidohydrolase
METAMTAPRFTAACIQMCSTRDVLRNRDDVVAMVRQAVAQGADFVQTPEMTSLVERDRKSLFEKIGPEEQDPVLAALRDVAREKGTVIHIGSIAVKVGEKVANRGFLIGQDGEIIARYDKVHLFDVDLPNGESWRESNTYCGGDKAVVAETPWGMLGMTICYDVRFAALYKAQSANGASFLSAPACFTRQTGEAHWHVLHRARAIETGSFMISAAQSGIHEDGRETYGHSLIIDPWGRVLADAKEGVGIILAEIDTDLVADARGRIPTLKNAREFHVETVSVEPAPKVANG